MSELATEEEFKIVSHVSLENHAAVSHVAADAVCQHGPERAIIGLRGNTKHQENLKLVKEQMIRCREAQLEAPF